jgi:broad specificity phosphatase PhoE
VVSSLEPKAEETGRLVAEQLAIPWRIAPDLHEHDRRSVPHLRSGEFISMIELFFRTPRQRVLGNESAEEAKSRIGRAIGAVIESEPGKNIAIVTHGTVLALYAAPVLKRAPFELWRKMSLPSFVAIRLPEMSEVKVVEKVG